MGWNTVKAVLPYAKAIVWDGCHKIYLAMDDEQVKVFEGYGYTQEPAQMIPVKDPKVALAKVEEWFADSCGLRFVEAVRTVAGDPNDGFDNLIQQFELDEPEDN